MPKCFASKILAISSERHIKVYYISLPLYRWEMELCYENIMKEMTSANSGYIQNQYS